MNTKQNWKGMDGAIAWHLIERQATNWSEVGEMMSEWFKDNQKEWVGLTGEEKYKLFHTSLPLMALIEEIEYKLKQKNT